MLWEYIEILVRGEAVRERFLEEVLVKQGMLKLFILVTGHNIKSL